MAVGGVSFVVCAQAMRTEVLTKLRNAEALTVGNVRTQSLLRDAGIEAPLMPDPASMIAMLFDERIQAHARHGEVARVRRAYLHGYRAVQFSADFGDDATLSRTVVQLDALDDGIVLFRAGAAPWHDDIGVYARLKRHMQKTDVTIFESLNVWDICVLIAHSAGWAAVCMAASSRWRMACRTRACFIRMQACSPENRPPMRKPGRCRATDRRQCNSRKAVTGTTPERWPHR